MTALLLAALVAAPRPIEWIVVVVNHEVITHTEVEEALRAAAARAGRNVEEVPPAEIRRLREEVVESLVEERLVVQEARRRGITVEPAEVREGTEETIRNLKEAFASPQEFERALAQEFLTEEALSERYRTEVEERLLRDRLIDEVVRAGIRVDRAEVAAAHEARREVVRTRHVLVADEETAREVLRRLRAGEDFAAVARRHSIDGSAARGGEIGEAGRGQLDAAYEAVAFSLPPRRLSEPVRSRYGWHVIEVLDRRTIDLPPLDDAMERRLRSEIFARKVGEALRALVEDLKEEAHIEIRPDPGR
jgi:parvulin-like peptidyl-prolyl isomerase